MTKEYEEVEEPLGAVVKVIKGGNRVLQIKVHCVVRDHKGQLQWEQDAIGKMIVPANYAPTGFTVEGPIETKIVSE